MEIAQLLASAEKCRRNHALLSGCFGWIGLIGTIIFALFALDNLARLPGGIRLPLAIATLVTGAMLLLRQVLTPLLFKRSPEATALLLERQYGIDDNLLINAYQLGSQQLTPLETALARCTIDHAKQQAAGWDIAALWPGKRIYRLGILAALIVGLWLVYALLFPRQLTNAWARYSRPLADVPPAGYAELQINPASAIQICEGENLVVTLIIGKISIVTPISADPPVIAWQPGADHLCPFQQTQHQARMTPVQSDRRQYRQRFTSVQTSFAFRIYTAGTYSASIQVVVVPFPKIKSAGFTVVAPPYTGGAQSSVPGPPASVSLLPGSRLGLTLVTDRPVQSVRWRVAGRVVDCESIQGKWQAIATLSKAGRYRLEATIANGRQLSLAKADIALASDRSPQINFLTDNHNRLLAPGSTLVIAIEAQDDYGIRQIEVIMRPTDATANYRLKQWQYLGPPGNQGPVRETLTVQIDPQHFVPGRSYLVQAIAGDFCPDNAPGKSKPLLLRIQSPDEIKLAEQDPLATAFELLRETIIAQRRAKEASENFRVYFLEALQKETVAAHAANMTEQQGQTRGKGLHALVAFERTASGKQYSVALAGLVRGEMLLVLQDIGKIIGRKAGAIPVLLAKIEKRQQYILDQLIALLGRIGQHSDRQPLGKGEAKSEDLPQVTIPEAATRLKQDLKEFTAAQRKLIERNKSLLSKGPEDLSEQQEKILGELAREENKWAEFLQEKLTDFSKLPRQDFSDSSLADELNEVYQEIQLAAKALYQNKIELAVPHEQAGLEKAEQLIHNLEKWLPDTPDNKKWVMEDPPAGADAPIADLPAELEDIVGELVDQEQNMTDDVEDVSSSWMDSLDKGAGWGASDGPMSNMSAKGVTGNLLPNNNEIGGRSGEGRSGRSHGQMIEKTADGKGGRETPTRLSPSPFEAGSVQDSAKNSKGGATGGGKLSGFAEEGLRGPTPPPLQQKMLRLAGQQGRIRQQAEKLTLRLQSYRLPSGDLQTAVQGMQTLEQSARQGQGGRINQKFSQIMDALHQARKSMRQEIGLRRERLRLPQQLRQEIMNGWREGIPRGYEELISEYFKSLAERRK